MMRTLLAAVVLTVSVTGADAAEPRVERNVVYGMYSGLALLMDVHRPAAPNGRGIVIIPGSGFHTAQCYDAASIKDGTSAVFASVPPLLEAGFTLFVVNHRAAPRFRYPAAVEDAQPAARFIRFHATDYGVAPEYLGALGSSSGGYLAAMLGVLDGAGNADDTDPVNRVSARVQAVVTNAANSALAEDFAGNPSVVSFMGLVPPAAQAGARDDPVVAAAYREASPVTHASRAAAPLLLIHGDADSTVPFHQAEIMLAAMQRADGTVELIRLAGGEHRFPLDIGAHPEWPNIFVRTVQWFERHLDVERRPR
jgi:acetyl esterase/lipase